MQKLVVMLRVKDGQMFIDEWLRCFEKLVDEIVVLDNGSTDGTYEILCAHPKVVEVIQTEGYNEGRDKNLLYEMARKREPDWCLWLDVDELFEPALTRKDFERLMSRSLVNKYGFRRFHFIDHEHFAGSGDYWFYTTIHDRVMWRESSKGYFENFILDSPNVKGISGIKVNTSFRLKHLGYINKDLVNKKAEIYSSLIDSKEEVSLQRMVQRMDLNNEVKIKWHDDRDSDEVKKLNARLNLLQFLSLFKRGFNKGLRIINRRIQKVETQAA